VTDGTLAIRVRGLHKRYGDTIAVKALDLEVRRGECFGLLGPNGAGKTTTIEILEGLTPRDAGEVEVLGMTWEREGDRIRARLGVQLQESEFPDRATVIELARLFRSFYPKGRDPDELIRIVQLEEKRDTQVRNLSGGQRQRLSVACALAGAPDLLFLDDPTTGLDPQSRRQLWALLERFGDRGGTILITTHYMDEAHELCDRVGIMDQGKLIALGTPRELVASLGAEHVIEFALGDGTRPEPAALAALPGVRDVRIDESHTHLSTSELHRTVPALLDLLRAKDAALSQLGTHSATLEDVFVTLTGRQLRDE